ncbi:MAG: hypothetical protein LBE83_06945 [Propionibacteriaceae bacterium]|jgi:hypothetical protein|nr:hypothetical protein [Propionibacteriaceae bacterium]
MEIKWMELLSVVIVTIIAAVAIASLLSLANWARTAPEGADGVELSVSTGRKVLEWVAIGLTALVVLFGLWLLIPYFPKPWKF